MLWTFNTTPAVAHATDWTIDSKASSVQFVARTGSHIRAKGTFSQVSGTLKYDPANLKGSSISARIPIATMSTGVSVRDEDLKGAKYFNVIRFPTASFTSSAVVRQSNGKYRMQGKLTLHGVSKAVEVIMEAPRVQAGALTAVGSATIDQKDFGLSLIQLHPDGAVRINKAIAITICLRATNFQ
ncbi:MAG: YceI family protein [Candidatus Obscuribacterales bacterium]